MSTTTIRLEQDLKIRVAAAAERAGKTAHAFILDAIALTVEQAEQEAAFQDLAAARRATVVASGKTVSWDAARPWVDARAGGERPRKPAARTVAR